MSVGSGYSDGCHPCHLSPWHDAWSHHEKIYRHHYKVNVNESAKGFGIIFKLFRTNPLYFTVMESVLTTPTQQTRVEVFIGCRFIFQELSHVHAVKERNCAELTEIKGAAGQNKSWESVCQFKKKRKRKTWKDPSCLLSTIQAVSWFMLSHPDK